MPTTEPRRTNSWASMTVEETVAALESPPAGLTDAEVVARRARDGTNALQAHRVGALSVLGRQFRNAVLILLLATAVLAGVLGDLADAAIISVILLASVALGFGNEYAAERASARLRSALSQTAVVVRGGVPTTIPAADLVVGDRVELSLGCRVPADLRLLSTTDLACDESPLSGESLPTGKDPAPVPAGTAIGDLTDLAFMGTIVRSGSGSGVVVGTGATTELGRLAHGLDQRAPETEFQAGLRRFSMLLVWVAAVLVLTILVTGLLLQRPLLESVLFALAIAVGITPQLLPAVVNTSLAAGSRRLARARVLVKRLVCIEDLGNIAVLVTDKTGTLTVGTMTLDAAIDPAGAPLEQLAGLAASAVGDGVGPGTTDALDAALIAVTGRRGTPVALRPFDHERRMSSALVDTADGRILVCKGAPESVFARCVDLPATAAAVAEDRLRRGARLIAVATRPAPGASAIGPDDEAGLTLRGFLSFADPPHPEARVALGRLDELGIRLVIATGDHPAVAAEIAGSLGLAVGAPLAGADLDALSDRELAHQALAAGIVARISPEQKERLVRVLRADHTTVGFLGDGVNDALALHAADVGISVDTATDVAKDAADVVLLEKSLDVIADGVSEGRRIFANTLKYVFMAASGNFGNMISAAAASAFLPFLPMLPGQILLGNLLYDGSQLTISSDRVDRDALERPARWDIGSIRRFMLVFGPLSSIFDLATFALLIGVFHAGAVAFHTGWFIEGLATQALVVLVIRTRRTPFLRSRPGLALLVALLVIVALALALPFTPIGAFLGFQPPSPLLLLAIAGVVLCYLMLADLAKWIFFRVEAARGTAPHPRIRRLRRAMSGFGSS